MDITFEKPCVEFSACMDEELKNFDYEKGFEEKAKALKDSGFADEETFSLLMKTGYCSGYFQKAFIHSMDVYSEEYVASRLFVCHSGGVSDSRFNYMENKIFDSMEEWQIFLSDSVKLEMAGIAFRDIAGLASLKDTLNDLSMLADAAIKGTVSNIHKSLSLIYGEPEGQDGEKQELIVLAMGKLGAYELNFSSDIDLVFVFPGSGYTSGEKSISSEQFFIKLCQKFVWVFKGTTFSGEIFRVDLRLRPFGSAGPLVMSIKAMEHYYETQGREWERYALIKARSVTGRKEHVDLLSRALSSFVFRRYLDYGAFDSMREMKSKIMIEVRKKSNESNIKNGSGGIREVEFFGQIFQLIRGGVDNRFKQRPIINILKLLEKEGMVPGEVIDGLEKGYCYLRLIENRIQQFEGDQTHLFPDAQDKRKKIAFSLGYSRTEDLLDDLEKTRSYIHSQFMDILSDSSDESDESLDDMKGLWGSPDDCEFVSDYQGLLSEDILQLLCSFKKDISKNPVPVETSEKLDRLMPFLLREFVEKDVPRDAVIRVFELVAAILKKSCYLSLLIENQRVISQLVNLCVKSSWVGSYLKKHPVLLDELLDFRTLYHPPGKEELRKMADSRLSGIDSGDMERMLESLCVLKQSVTLRIAAAEISGEYPLMKISDRLTDLAEVLVEKVLFLAWNELVSRFGFPVDKSGNRVDIPEVAVIAYGKLGGIELGYGSDLDLVFLHRDVKGMTDGGEPVSCVNFYSKLAQKTVSYLSAYTSAGKMYEVDLRLRPGGNTGVVIVSLSAFASYFSSDAWVFEHQAFVKSRVIFGFEDIAKNFVQLRRRLLSVDRNPLELKREVSLMRERIVKAKGCLAKGAGFHLKYDRGGMMDIEFIVQFLVLLNAKNHSGLSKYTDVVRILSSLESCGIVPRDEAAFLRAAYLSLRGAAHQLDLMDKASVVDPVRFLDIREGVVRVWGRYLEK